MKEVEEVLKESPFFKSLPPKERQALVEAIFRKYLDEETQESASPSL